MPKLDKISEEYDIQVLCYGYAGDGNLHGILVKNPDKIIEMEG